MNVPRVLLLSTLLLCAVLTLESRVGQVPLQYHINLQLEDRDLSAPLGNHPRDDLLLIGALHHQGLEFECTMRSSSSASSSASASSLSSSDIDSRLSLFSKITQENAESYTILSGSGSNPAISLVISPDSPHGHTLDNLLHPLRNFCDMMMETVGDQFSIYDFCFQRFLTKSSIDIETEKRDWQVLGHFSGTRLPKKDRVSFSWTEGGHLIIDFLFDHSSPEEIEDWEISSPEEVEENLRNADAFDGNGQTFESVPQEWRISYGNRFSHDLLINYDTFYLEQNYGDSLVVQFHCGGEQKTELAFVTEVITKSTSFFLAVIYSPNVCTIPFLGFDLSPPTINCKQRREPNSSEQQIDIDISGDWAIFQGNSVSHFLYTGTLTFTQLSYFRSDAASTIDSASRRVTGTPFPDFYHLRWNLNENVSYRGLGILQRNQLCSVWSTSNTANLKGLTMIKHDGNSLISGFWYFDELFGYEIYEPISVCPAFEDWLSPVPLRCSISPFDGLYAVTSFTFSDLDEGELVRKSHLLLAVSSSIEGAALHLTWIEKNRSFWTGNAIVQGGFLCSSWMSEYSMSTPGLVTYQFDNNVAKGLWTVASRGPAPLIRTEDLIRKREDGDLFQVS